MISPILYQLIYVIFVAVGTIFCISRYSNYSYARISQCENQSDALPALFITIALIFFIGFRPISSAFVDTANYDFFYKRIAANINMYRVGGDVKNLLFDNLMILMATNKIDVSYFFFIISAIYFGSMFVALKRIFPNDITYALFIYLGAFSTFSYATNGIKAGAAASLFLLVFANYKYPIRALFICLISWGFHHSMYFPIIAYWIVFFFRKPKYYFGIWIACFILAAMHITYFQNLFADSSESAASYLLNDVSTIGMKSGFRLDFILYAFIPIAVGYWVIYKKKCQDRLYELLLCTYLLTNAIWMLTMYAAFNNRIAYLSWFMLPVVLAYPFLKFRLLKNQYQYLNYCVFIYLVFEIYAYNYL